MSEARYKVVVTDQVFPDTVIEQELLATIGAQLHIATGATEEVLAVARDADALLNTYLPIDQTLLDGLERCRVIARYGIGVDNVDLAVAKARDIVVTNVPDYCVDEVAAHALAMLLALLRRLPEGDRVLRAGGWGVDELRPMKRLTETTVGLVGVGRIGAALATMLRGCGVRVIAHDPYTAPPEGVAAVGFDELLATADAVSLHSPLTSETRGMIDRSALASMQPHAVLVNTSRGPLVVLEDLLDALRSGTIRAAGLDVFEHEPPDPQQLADVPGLLATPHSAFYSEAALRESQTKATNQVIKVLTGAPPDYQVNR